MKNVGVPNGTKSFEEILAAAQSANGDDIRSVEAILIDASRLDALRRHAVLNALKSATGIGLGALRQAAYDLTGKVM